jgi:putative transposase
MDFRRAWVKGGWYFFTVVAHQRQPLLTIPENIARLRVVMAGVKKNRPFAIPAIVILPDHLHCLWQLPEDDDDFATRWRLIKHDFSIGCSGATAKISLLRRRKGERNVWQPRFFEHVIRDEDDWKRHMDYIAYNPVKHGYVSNPADWEFGSFRRLVEKGWYPPGWGATEPETVKGMEFE